MSVVNNSSKGDWEFKKFYKKGEGNRVKYIWYDSSDRTYSRVERSLRTYSRGKSIRIIWGVASSSRKRAKGISKLIGNNSREQGDISSIGNLYIWASWRGVEVIRVISYVKNLINYGLLH